MTYSWPVYIVLAIVAAISFGTALFLPTADILRWVSGVPALVALIGVVLQIFRDHAQHEKALAIQRDQQHFILGVTSHMANVAFDKHVEFCEKYISQMQETLSTLFYEGPTKKCLELASKLADIRLSFRTWLTSEIQDKILPFEKALVKIGANEQLLKDLPGGTERTETVKEVYDIFSSVLDIPRDGRVVDVQVASGRIMDNLQAILGVKQLVQLRIALVDKAVKTLEGKG